jgi:hypothetical protein
MLSRVGRRLGRSLARTVSEEAWGQLARLAAQTPAQSSACLRGSLSDVVCDSWAWGVMPLEGWGASAVSCACVERCEVRRGFRRCLWERLCGCSLVQLARRMS